MEEKKAPKKTLLSVKDLEVKFRVRGRTLTAIRGLSLDIYENESIAIVGESAAGKSVFTKTFAGMLDENGYISKGSVIFNDAELADTWVNYGDLEKTIVREISKKLNFYSKAELGAGIYRRMLNLKSESRARFSLGDEDSGKMDAEIKALCFRETELYNLSQTIAPYKERQRHKDVKAELSLVRTKIRALENTKKRITSEHKARAKKDSAYIAGYRGKMSSLKADYEKACGGTVPSAVIERNAVIAKEIYLSVGRFNFQKQQRAIHGLLKALKKAMRMGVDLYNENERTRIFDEVAFRVKYIEETENKLHGNCIINLAKLKYSKDWCQVRGKRIATVFQDPMTSLNPIITIGKQITSIILKHQNCSEVKARAKAIELMKKVGIPNAENRYDDYPFQYSGGMRQRIVIAIALSCQPKILICDEPTTALDVTIQAQILKLIKDLQKEFHYTIVFITHDLGVVASIADRVAVLYAGQLVELGTVDEVFFDPRHPYTWALLSSLPQLAQRNTELFSISGTPPSLYNDIVGDPFAPRNPYCLRIDTLKAPPLFRVSDTHYAKTWLLDPRAPKIEKPDAIKNLHEKMIKAFRI